MVAGLGKKAGKLATVLATALSVAGSAAYPMPAMAQETTLPTGEYGMKNYKVGLDATGAGETKLYLMKDQYASVGNEGSVTDTQLHVTIPVGIHYTVMGNRILGPVDDKVFFRNKTSTSDVHISGIVVQEANGASIVTRDTPVPDFPHDALWLGMRPDSGHYNANSFVKDNTGHNDELGAYVGDDPQSPTYKNDWDIVSGGALALNGLGGGAGTGFVFDQMNPAVETQIGTVRWTVRLGTRAEADARDASVTLRFHANGGAPVSGQPLDDVSVPVLDAEALPEVQVIEGVEGTELPDATDQLFYRVVNEYGNVNVREFEGWMISPDSIELVEDLSDIVEQLDGVESVEDLAGKTITLYASYL